MRRRSLWHALNSRHVAKAACARRGLKYEATNLVVVHMGGGVSLSAHRNGRSVDVVNPHDEGAFSPIRAGALPSAAIAAACFAEGSSKSLVTERLIRRGGLLDLLGTSDLREVERRADAGDERAVLIRRAMIYAVAKQIGAMAVACGRPALIVISGGMARSKRFVQEIVERVEFLAPVEVFPGEQETTALVLGALRVMRGEEPARRYEPWKA